ncbi:MAG TPA: hypothetical protein VLL54_16440 [Pyrinomonadaceae bacterium]|nr:hypothetical protein [Pyrinomonadaceae bacterium]
MELVGILLSLAGLGAVCSLFKWLIDLGWKKGGKWLNAASVVNALSLLVILTLGLYVLIEGVAQLLDESWPIAFTFVGAVAYSAYFYIAKGEAKRKSQLTPKLAEEIVQHYGAALEHGLSDGRTAIPESLLPCSKERIKQAFKLALAFQIDYDSLKEEDRSTLVAGLMYLGQFVPDAQANLINEGPRTLANVNYNEFQDLQINAALEVKEEMDSFVAQITALDKFDPLFHQKTYSLIGLEYSDSVKQDFSEFADSLRR